MLDNLDSIPWHKLQHAYGTAEDVPDLLRALAESGRWNEAMSELYGNIWHQGTVYEASVYAVPFLFELVAEPSIAWRGEILGLIGAMAEGSGYLEATSTHDAVFEHIQTVVHRLGDADPSTRSAAAYVLSQFPEQASELASHLRQAAVHESNPLARAAILVCLGRIRDNSEEARELLERTLRESKDLRETFAAASALCQLKGVVTGAALPVCRQMAAATWFAEGFLSDVPFDFAAQSEMEELLADIEPDSASATWALLEFMDCVKDNGDLCACIMHDLLALNFDGGKWRECRGLTDLQSKVLRSVVEREFMWSDARQLFFLFPRGGRKVSELQPSDIRKVRTEMAALLKKL